MKEAKKAAFSFERFRIPSFSFEEPKSANTGIKMAFAPSGEYNSETHIFKLIFDFVAYQGEDAQDKKLRVVNVILYAYFKFEADTSFNDIPVYFYRNSMAIVFPFLRAFVGTLTLQANVKPLVMPILNLSELEQPLRENTKCFPEQKTDTIMENS